jgi:hypothetical protein
MVLEFLLRVFFFCLYIKKKIVRSVIFDFNNFLSINKNILSLRVVADGWKKNIEN